MELNQSHTPSQQPEKQPDKSALIVLFLTVFIDLLGFGLVLPLMPFYATRFGADAFVIGLLMSVFSLAQFLFSPVWGAWSDKIGRRTPIIISLFASAIGLVIFALASNIWILFLSRLFSGIATATVSLAQAYIADSTTPENRAKGLGMIGAAFGLGFLFGPALGGVLAQYGSAVPALVGAAIAFGNGVFALLKLKESLPPEARATVVKQNKGFSLSRFQKAFAVPKLGPHLAAYFLFIFGFATMEATFALLTMKNFHFTEVQNGYMFAFIGLIVVVLQGGLIGRLTKRFGEKNLVVAGGFILAVSLAMMPLVLNLPLFVALAVPVSIGNGLLSAPLMSLISKRASASAQGEVLGIGQSMASLGRILGPLWGGFAFARVGAPITYGVAGGLISLVAVMALIGQIEDVSIEVSPH
jgi:MFS transporter, DHA1 family, tetracycline resistance protein